MKAWLAFWMDGKTRRSKTFSSKLYGFEEARIAAVTFLQTRKRESGMDVCIFPVGEDHEDVSAPCTPVLPAGTEDDQEGSSTAVSSRPSETSSSFISQQNSCLSS